MIRTRSMRASAYIFVSPLLLFVLVFMVYPLLSTGWLAFTDWNGFTDPVWSGLSNVRRLIADDSFAAAVKNMIILTCYIPLWVLLPLFFAELVRRPGRYNSMFRATVLTPYVVSPVILGMLFRQLLGVEGVISMGVENLLGFRIGFLTEPSLVIHTIALITLFKFFGFGVILYYGAMGKISESLYESAELDGCSWLQTLRYITVPGIKFTMQFFLVLGFITFYARMFPLTFTLTKGGPGFSSFVPEFGIYYQAFNNSRMGYAATWALFVYLITLIVTLIQNSIMLRSTER